jgi:hypothetical protein
MFEYHENTLCVESSWLIDRKIFNRNNYHYHASAGNINVIRRGCRSVKALIEFESIPDRIKSKIVQIAGDPYKKTKHIVFTDYLNTNLEAQKYFQNYVTNDDKALPEKNINEYTANASILTTIDVMMNNKLAKRRALGVAKTQVWQKMAKVVSELTFNQWPHSLPSNHRRLKQKYNQFKTEGFDSLVHGNFCNKNSEKINDNAKMWLVSRWADQVNKIANTMQLFAEYNKLAKDEGWKKLKSEQTIYNYLHQEDIKPLWYGHRFGEVTAKEKYTMHLKTKMPSQRDSLWYSDGTKLNYYYQDENGKMQTCQVYEVIDTYSEVLLGYHISKSEDYEAQYFAYKMAAKTSGHRPYQIGFDGQGGHKKLQSGEFLTKLARLSIKTQPYNGKSKTIESIFGRFQQQFLKRDWFFTGQNITTKKQESKANMEFILANQRDLPSLDEIKATYAKRRKEWNEATHHKTGKPRISMYLESTNAEAPELSMFDMVDLFWILRDKPVTYNASGLSFTEKGAKYEYLVYDEDRRADMNFHRKSIDKKFHIKFDPEDMTMIYLYEDTPLGLRFITAAETKIEVSRARQEITEFEEDFVRDIIQRNKDLRVDMRNETEKILENHGGAAHQQGLRSPNIKGVESSRRQKSKLNKPKPVKKKELELAQFQKEVSNSDEYDPYDMM